MHLNVIASPNGHWNILLDTFDFHLTDSFAATMYILSKLWAV